MRDILPGGRPDLVIFDCDGVLIDSEILASRVTAETLSACGYPVTEHEVTRRFTGVPAREMRAIVEGELGRPLPEDFAARDAEALRARFGAELRAIAGAASLLDDLALPVCIASSSLPDRLALTLALTRLDGYFAGTVFSGVRVARGKPAPDIFLLAAREMGADPGRTLVVEDSVAGVRAGRAAGMSVVGFLGGSHCGPDHGRWLTEAGAHRLVANFADLRALLPASAFVRRTARA